MIEEIETKETSTPWWKYVLAVIAFIFLFFAAPIICNLALLVSNLFTPREFQNTQEWMFVLSTVLGVAFSCYVIEIIVEKKHPIFCMVICIIAAFYMVAVSVWNYALGATEIANLIGMWGGAIASIGFAIRYGMLVNKTDENH